MSGQTTEERKCEICQVTFVRRALPFAVALRWPLPGYDGVEIPAPFDESMLFCLRCFGDLLKEMGIVREEIDP